MIDWFLRTVIIITFISIIKISPKYQYTVTNSHLIWRAREKKIFYEVENFSISIFIAAICWMVIIMMIMLIVMMKKVFIIATDYQSRALTAHGSHIHIYSIFPKGPFPYYVTLLGGGGSEILWQFKQKENLWQREAGGLKSRFFALRNKWMTPNGICWKWKYWIKKDVSCPLSIFISFHIFFVFTMALCWLLLNIYQINSGRYFTVVLRRQQQVREKKNCLIKSWFPVDSNEFEIQILCWLPGVDEFIFEVDYWIVFLSAKFISKFIWFHRKMR